MNQQEIFDAGARELTPAEGAAVILSASGVMWGLAPLLYGAIAGRPGYSIAGAVWTLGCALLGASALHHARKRQLTERAH